jgi:hypothetical protein
MSARRAALEHLLEDLGSGGRGPGQGRVDLDVVPGREVELGRERQVTALREHQGGGWVDEQRCEEVRAQGGEAAQGRDERGVSAAALEEAQLDFGVRAGTKGRLVRCVGAEVEEATSGVTGEAVLGDEALEDLEGTPLVEAATCWGHRVGCGAELREDAGEEVLDDVTRSARVGGQDQAEVARGVVEGSAGGAAREAGGEAGVGQDGLAVSAGRVEECLEDAAVEVGVLHELTVTGPAAEPEDEVLDLGLGRRARQAQEEWAEWLAVLRSSSRRQQLEGARKGAQDLSRAERSQGRAATGDGA